MPIRTLTLAPVPLIAVTFALTLRQGASVAKPSDVCVVPRVRVMVPRVIQSASADGDSKFETSITMVAAPAPDDVVP